MPRKHLGVTVTVYDSSDEIIRQRKGNHADSTFRAWISRITSWALNQGHDVEINRIREGQ